MPRSGAPATGDGAATPRRQTARAARRRARAAALAAALLAATPTAAQQGTATAPLAGESVGDLARIVQNPIGELIRFPLQNNTNFGVGPRGGAQNILDLEPVIPFPLNDDWTLKTRTILPLTWQPSLQPASGTVPFGLGATTLSLYLSPRRVARDGLSWGVGPVVQIPTATDPSLGSPVWGAGPSMILVHSGGPRVSGVIAYNVWSMGGTPGRDGTRYNTMQVQLFTNYNFGDGWFVGTAPTINANWRASGKDAWTLPVGGHVGQLLKLGGKLPVNWLLGAYYNVLRPDDGPDWQLRFQVTFLY